MKTKQFEEVSCVVCGTYNDEKLCTHGQFGLPANVVVCKKCGLSYLNPRWDKDSIIDFYVNDYDTYYRPDMSKTLKSKSSYIPVFERLKKEDVFDINTINNVLDVGSGEGANLEYLMEQIPKANYYGIEPSTKCQEVLKKIGVKILASDVEENFDEKYQSHFDLIIMRHVLEHFGNPVDVIKKVSQMLKEDGILYIAVPNSLKAGRSSILDHWIRVVHTFYFNRKTLKNVFDKANVEVCTMYEGDSYNQMELIAVVKKGNGDKLVISAENYEIQKNFFEKKIKKEKAPLHQLRKIIRKIIKKVSK
jgi:2-polyprenyl-3-methyl-5-hydroxy-6-metoxy-1,4-benzoquinol methylase